MAVLLLGKAMTIDCSGVGGQRPETGPHAGDEAPAALVAGIGRAGRAQALPGPQF
jgi:hypothetical protein